MLLEHYTEKPFEMEEREYKQEVHHKPRGLWLSARGEDDWPNWIAAEQFHLEMFVKRHIATLDPSGNFLWIHNEAELRTFHQKYASSIHPTVKIEYIDWSRVTADYDGIFIAPYIHTARLDFTVSWYYTWDVASGCVWNLEKIKIVPFEFGELDAEVARSQRLLAYNAEVMLERANNKMRYGVEDPTGGRGRLPLTLDQMDWPQFEKWTKTNA